MTFILMGISSTSSYAFDRNMVVANARTVINPDWVFSNIIHNVVSAGPTQVGSTNHSLPAYAQIAQNIAQIQALKQQLLSFHP